MHSSLLFLLHVRQFLAQSVFWEINSKMQISERCPASNKHDKVWSQTISIFLVHPLPTYYRVNEKELLFTVRNLVHFTKRSFKKKKAAAFFFFFLNGVLFREIQKKSLSNRKLKLGRVKKSVMWNSSGNKTFSDWIR